MGIGIRLGSIAGIEIRLDWSLIIIFLLVATSLGGAVFPAWHPDWGAGLIWLVAVAAAFLFFASVLVHELSHALVGRAQGMSVRRITLFVFGGMAHLESEPRTWSAELWMAIVGPVTSLAIGFACIYAAGAVAGEVEVNASDPLAALAPLGPLTTILLWLGPINILLGVFNLVPGFPLDGGRVLRALLWGVTGDLLRATRWATGLGRLVGGLLIAGGIMMMLGVRLPVFGTGLIGGLWIALIGWFLHNAALSSYRQAVVRRSLEDVPVSRLMLAEFATVAPDLTVAELIDRHLLASDQRSFPVLDDGRLVGLVSLDDVRRLAPEARMTSTVADIMIPRERLEPIAPGASADEAFERLSRGGATHVPVIDEGELRGLLRREDVVKWVALRSSDPAFAP